MSYCTQADLIQRFSQDEILQLTDRGEDGAIDASVLQDASADADAEIDAYVGVRYTLPLLPVPSVLTRIACDITRFRLYDDHAPNEVQERYDAALEFLKSVAAGKVSLGPADDGTLAETSDTAEIHSAANVFARRRGCAQP